MVSRIEGAQVNDKVTLLVLVRINVMVRPVSFLGVVGLDNSALVEIHDLRGSVARRRLLGFFLV